MKAFIFRSASRRRAFTSLSSVIPWFARRDNFEATPFVRKVQSATKNVQTSSFKIQLQLMLNSVELAVAIKKQSHDYYQRKVPYMREVIAASDCSVTRSSVTGATIEAGIGYAVIDPVASELIKMGAVVGAKHVRHLGDNWPAEKIINTGEVNKPEYIFHAKCISALKEKGVVIQATHVLRRYIGFVDVQAKAVKKSDLVVGETGFNYPPLTQPPVTKEQLERLQQFYTYPIPEASGSSTIKHV